MIFISFDGNYSCYKERWSWRCVFPAMQVPCCCLSVFCEWVQKPSLLAQVVIPANLVLRQEDCLRWGEFKVSLSKSLYAKEMSGEGWVSGLAVGRLPFLLRLSLKGGRHHNSLHWTALWGDGNIPLGCFLCVGSSDHSVCLLFHICSESCIYFRTSINIFSKRLSAT